jgi:hypothetical protein
MSGHADAAGPLPQHGWTDVRVGDSFPQSPNPTRVPQALVWATGAYLVIAVGLHLTWINTGDDAWIAAYKFLTTGFLVATAAVGAAHAIAAQRFFAPAEPMRVLWMLFVLATVARWAGHGIVDLSALVPPDQAKTITKLGTTISGPGYLALLAIGLTSAIRFYRRLGVLGRLTRIDLILAGMVSLFAVQFMWDVMRWHSTATGTARILDVIGWSSDPLLAVLMIEVLAIRRAAVRIGIDDVSRCWTALAAGIFLTWVGDVGIWATGHEIVTWPWTSLFWYVWPLAETAYALAPVWQVIACRTAHRYERAPVSRPPVSQPAPARIPVLPFAPRRDSHTAH